MSNIIGDPFKPFVTEQINKRQKLLSSTFKDDTFLKYVSKTPWLRMASAIDINDRDKLSSLNIDAYGGSEAAKQFVLQGGSLAVNRNGETVPPSYTSLGAKFGVATDNSIINSNSYGFGGSDWGKTPMPGLTSVRVQDYNKGAIRKATVDFTCTNIQQFEIINTLYMRVGYNVLIEWGHTMYLDNEGSIQQRINFNTPAFSSFFEGKNTSNILSDIIIEQVNTSGNYDGFIGRITNFTWRFVDGSYECSIEVLTQGDIIDSLKVNTTLAFPKFESVFSATEQAQFTDEQQSKVIARQDNIDVPGVNGDRFVLEQQGFAPEDQPKKYFDYIFINNKDSNVINSAMYQGYLELTNSDSDNNLNVLKTKKFEEESKNGFVRYFKFSDGNTREYFYISLGELLTIIENNNLLYDLTGELPIISIDKDYRTNFCTRFPEQVSTDWSKCFLPYKVLSGNRAEWTTFETVLNSNNNTDNPDTKDSILGPKSKRYDGENYVGNLMCILINANFITQLIQDNSDVTGRFSLKDFINSLLQGIQGCTGDINKFEAGYDYQSNTLKIYDNSPFTTSQLVRRSTPELARFQSYGVQPSRGNEDTNNRGSFLLDIDIESSITPEITNMIAAGAQVNGNQVGINATAFSLWNKGLIDRVRKTNLDSQTLQKEKTERELEEVKLKNNNILNFKENKDKLFKLLRGMSNRKSSPKDLIAASDINTDFANYYLGEVTKNVITNSEGKDIEYGLPSNFFIPFDLGLEMDGLSGMRIFDAFNITNEVLPAQYTDALQFVIKGVNHSITSNGWVTSLNSFTFTQYKAASNTPELPFTPTFARIGGSDTGLFPFEGNYFNPTDNNPGNIRPIGTSVNFQGVTGQKSAVRRLDDGTLKSIGDFLVFNTLDNGIRAAMKNLVTGYFNQGINTITSIINKYAPPKDGNETGNYVISVTNRMKRALGDTTYKDLTEETVLSFKGAEEKDEDNIQMFKSLIIAIFYSEGSMKAFGFSTLTKAVDDFPITRLKSI